MTKSFVVIAALVCAAGCGGSTPGSGDAGHGADQGVHAAHWPEVATSGPLGSIDVMASPSCVPLTRGTWTMTGTCGATTCTMSGDASTPCAGTLTCGSDAWGASTNGDVLTMPIGGGTCSAVTRATLISGTCAVGATTCSFDASYVGP